ncbi:MAG TPA: hypothetical protein DD381_09635 [Lentisphaeria bacterium]|nr:MAG: hypothetical protein A2X47_07510 [Lentisphaerae bacterium GWF2_38_69]HBM16585.1 hypothetical protein [Lentisphaeria bacterium]
MVRFSGIAVLAIFCALIVGCSTSYLSQPSSPVEVKTVANLEPDIEIGEQIEATATVNRICYMFIVSDTKFADGVNYGGPYVEESVNETFWGDTILEAKAAAAYKACAENKADVIICPRYYVVVDTYPFYKHVRAKVFGYKGNIKGVKVASQKPLQTQPVKIVNGVKISDAVQLAQPLKVTSEVQVKNPLTINQPITVKTISDTTRK